MLLGFTQGCRSCPGHCLVPIGTTFYVFSKTHKTNLGLDLDQDQTRDMMSRPGYSCVPTGILILTALEIVQLTALLTNQSSLGTIFETPNPLKIQILNSS